jgi:hypothetical protein
MPAADIAKAIKWVHDNAKEYGGSPDTIFVAGHSAGAHLAALVCTDDCYLKAETLPALWTACAFGSWRQPGDEYGLLGVSMLISIWLVILIHSDNLSQAILPLIAAGAVPMAVFGFLLDRLPVSRRLWAAIYIVASVALFAWGLSSFPSPEKAIAKSGSISAHAFCSANQGMDQGSEVDEEQAAASKEFIEDIGGLENALAAVDMLDSLQKAAWLVSLKW